MKLLVGLGNPGSQYIYTRHNAGFLLLDQRVKENGGQRSQKSSFHGEIAEIVMSGEKMIYLKPMTFMNLSGKSVLAVMQFYKIEPNDVLVLHDEIDFPFAKIQIKQGGSHAGHNGIRDIYAKSGSQDFWRLRIGVGRSENVVDHVLTSFTKEEIPIFQADVITQGLLMMGKWIGE